MKWQIPAKTFLMGEYLALSGGPSILLTTAPCFEISLTETSGLHGIHPQSPAGLWWLRHGSHQKGLSCVDPYARAGGLGASSAQFLGSYLAVNALKKQTNDLSSMWQSYLSVSWNGQGEPPSGYDVLAQSQSNCVFIERNRGRVESCLWPFDDLSFVLFHTNQKLATHLHLATLTSTLDLSAFKKVARQIETAFFSIDDQLLIDGINQYHHALLKEKLVAQHTCDYIDRLMKEKIILAAKGCGALGADIILVIAETNHLEEIYHLGREQGLKLVANSSDLHQKNAIIENIPNKRLEFLAL